MGERQQLAAILFTDIVGYSALMSRDEKDALRCVEHQREAIQRLLPQFGGHLHKEIGDGTLSTFGSARQAVDCALALQDSLRDSSATFRVRAAIHIGEVTFSGGDVFGDGVNVAARLESTAGPGGVVVSDACLDALQGQTGLAYASLGDRRLKNIARPVTVYRVSRVGGSVQRWQWRHRHTWTRAAGLMVVGVALLWGWTSHRSELESLWTKAIGGTAGTASRPVRLAVLPFSNLSGDPDKDYLSDGLTEELIARLGQASREHLRVISRTSSMHYRKSAKPVEQIGRELAVDYVVEGTVRQEGQRYRVTAALTDVADRTQRWAQSFERQFEDVFSLQSDVARSVTSALAVSLLPDGQRRLTRNARVSPEAYDAYLKGLQKFHELTPKDLESAQRYFELAISKDRNFAPAYAGIAMSWSGRLQISRLSLGGKPKLRVRLFQ